MQILIFILQSINQC